MKFCWFHKFLFYYLYFELYSFNVSNVYYSTIHLHSCYVMNYCCNNISIHTTCIFIFTNASTKNEYIFAFNPTNSSIAKPPVSFFQRLTFLNYHSSMKLWFFVSQLNVYQIFCATYIVEWNRDTIDQFSAKVVNKLKLSEMVYESIRNVKPPEGKKFTDQNIWGPGNLWHLVWQ